MKNINESKNRVHEFLLAIGVKNPQLTKWSNFLSKPLYIIIVLSVLAIGILNLLPGLRKFIPFATEVPKEKDVATTTSTSNTESAYKPYPAIVNEGNLNIKDSSFRGFESPIRNTPTGNTNIDTTTFER